MIVIPKQRFTLRQKRYKNMRYQKLSVNICNMI